MDVDALSIIGIFFVSPIVISSYLAFRHWLNTRASMGPVQLSPALADRLDQLERQIESLAIEVERMAEGQRFVSKVLVERGSDAPALPGAPVVARGASDARPALAAADAARFPEDR